MVLNADDARDERAALEGDARKLSEVPGIAQVNSWAGSFTNEEQIRLPGQASDLVH